MNIQPIEKVVPNLKGFLQVHSIFHTIQGEGPFCGHAAIFIRLAGCNLQCPDCDTDYTSVRDSTTPHIILQRCVSFATSGLVVITGGEPFRQNIAPLVNLLLAYGYFVQVESNGTLAPSVDVVWSKQYWKRQGAYIVCSPKAGRINSILEAEACCFKYVIDHNSMNQEDGLPIKVLGHSSHPQVARVNKLYNRPIYLQPADVKQEAGNELNRQAAIESCKKFGYILQLQIHKLLNME